jgi:hypothetical protein
MACCLPTTANCVAQQNVSFKLTAQPDVLQLEYDVTISTADKTYLTETFRDMLPLWDQRHKKYRDRDSKPNHWDEMREIKRYRKVLK